MVSQSTQCGFTPRFGNPIGRELHSINTQLTMERLEELAKQFVDDCKSGENEKKGWPKTAYGKGSKLLCLNQGLALKPYFLLVCRKEPF